jgi:micrococcal nuclease
VVAFYAQRPAAGDTPAPLAGRCISADCVAEQERAAVMLRNPRTDPATAPGDRDAGTVDSLVEAGRPQSTRLLARKGAAVAARQAAIAAASHFVGNVIGVADGDTITVLRDRAPVKIRLDGVDCPEGGQDFGQRARQFTSGLVFGKTVTVDVHDVDRYGRLVARVSVGGVDVGTALVTAGLAWHYKQYSRDPVLAQAEVTARAQHVGLWRQPNPQPPWEFRHPPPQATARSSGPFHANVRSGVFHRQGCQRYDCQSCTRVFDTRAQAVTAGFWPAGDCQP